MKNQKGHLLVASPGLVDPNFRQTVILLIQDADEGTLGLILNRPSDKQVKDLWETIFKQPCETDQLLNLGGPVLGPLMVLHTRQELADLEICQGIYFSSQKNYLEEIVNHNVQPFKLFLGHSGWSEGQLRTEMEEGAWYSVPANRDFVFGDESELWQRTLYQAGRESLTRVLKTNHLPEDSSLN